MSAPVPPDTPIDRTELDRHIRKASAISALRHIGHIASELETEDRRSYRVLVLALVCLLIIAIGAGAAIWEARATREARNAEAAAAEAAAKSAPKAPAAVPPAQK
ncbi:MAG TPA: hypothetical protein VED01_13410 [Burkholderiales bacterium]|nr:hypothetical protein [Burkholderiales bacterium]